MTDHPRCVTIAKTRGGRRCAAKAALGDRCWVHGGAVLVGPCALTLDGGVPVIWVCDPDGRRRRNPKRASKWAAVQFIARGTVTHGLFVVRNQRDVQSVSRLLRRIERAGARVEPVRMGLVRVYRFEAAKHPPSPLEEATAAFEAGL